MIRTTTLDNGLRIVTQHMATVETASLGVWVEVGTRHEAPDVNGISHMLEHMAFKGTRRRTARAIAEEIEAVGGHLNAYTSRENTAYFAKVLKEDVALAIDLVADIVQNSVMDAAELDRERAVILQEIHQAHDTPDDIVFDNFQEAAFPSQAIGRPVLGRPDIVGTLGRQTLIDYMGTHYAAPRMVVAAAGNIDHDQMVGLVQSAFVALAPDAPQTMEALSYVGGEHRETRDLEQVHLVLGFEGVPYEDDLFYPAAVLSTLFGGGMSSRLFQEVREERGLVYTIYSFTSSYADGGLFALYAGTGEAEVGELVPVVCDEIAKVRDHVGTDEVARATAQLKASVLMSLESTSSRCEQLARQLQVYGRPLTTEEVVERIEAVDTTAVKAAAERCLGSVPTLAALGPLGQLEPLDAITARLR